MGTLGQDYYLPHTEPQPVGPAGRGPLYVGFWQRWFANWIDSIIIGSVTGGLDKLASEFPQTTASTWVLGAFSWLVISAYFIWFYSTTGQTLGKRWLGIKVVSIDGSPLNWRKGLLRYLGSFLSDFSFSLGYLWSIWDTDKQAWHDKLAGTRVVPAAATAEQVQVAFNQAQARPRSGAWKWAAAVTFGLELLLVVGCIVGVMALSAGAPPAEEQRANIHDGEWDVFQKALMDRAQPDRAIPYFDDSLTYDYDSQSGKATNLWLEINMTHREDCAHGSTGDWCYRLANELVQIVFDNYPHIDEIDGIHVMMTKVIEVGPLTLTYDSVDDKLTIDEWRARLGIPAP